MKFFFITLSPCVCIKYSQCVEDFLCMVKVYVEVKGYTLMGSNFIIFYFASQWS